MLGFVTHSSDNDDSRAPEATTEGETASEAGEDKKTKKAKKAKKKAQRKERVLHTRIPAVLETELKRTAKGLRVPVSNLVRTILEDAVSAAQAVGRAAEDELRGAADRLGHERDKWTAGASAAGEAVGKATAEPPADKEEDAKDIEAEASKKEKDPLEGVIGFQPIVLAGETRWSGCGAVRCPGGRALIGVRDEPGPRIIVGPECEPGKESD